MPYTSRKTNSLFFSLIQGCHVLSKDTQILSDWGIQGKLRTCSRIESVNWVAPNAPTIKVNTDGASRGVGVTTSSWAECLAIIEALEPAATKGWSDIWVETDSEATVQAFGSSQLPWALIHRWKHVQNMLQKFVITSIWREANFSADAAARKGVTLTDNIGRTYLGRPSWITRWEHPANTYYRLR
ncbi:hypothetical protein IFM89_026270 [Coptis chinensis]|uniref:RNase H type-1 domain-containing protein n=1 Tax=Coptis chinensis TaxID=261450 RepID=A0A835LXB2_9MAGN|nr:hypothetical protein IFM89_026270 [Coptis chinensis]